LVPDQPPLAVQLVALVLDQFSVELAPLAIEVGVAVRLTVGPVTTVTVAEACVLPPVPVQFKVYVVLLVSTPVDWLPEVAFVPDQPSLAVQLVALVLDQAKVELAPLATDVGVAVNVTVGAGITVTVAETWVLPPAPVQSRV
jgi:hypothetical protein